MQRIHPPCETELAVLQLVASLQAGLQRLQAGFSSTKRPGDLEAVQDAIGYLTGLKRCLADIGLPDDPAD